MVRSDPFLTVPVRFFLYKRMNSVRLKFGGPLKKSSLDSLENRLSQESQESQELNLRLKIIGTNRATAILPTKRPCVDVASSLKVGR